MAKEILKAIEAEINWCKVHINDVTISGISETYKKGFIAGQEHVRALILKLMEQYKGD